MHTVAYFKCSFFRIGNKISWFTWSFHEFIAFLLLSNVVNCNNFQVWFFLFLFDCFTSCISAIYWLVFENRLKFTCVASIRIRFNMFSQLMDKNIFFFDLANKFSLFSSILLAVDVNWAYTCFFKYLYNAFIYILILLIFF